MTLPSQSSGSQAQITAMQRRTWVWYGNGRAEDCPPDYMRGLMVQLLRALEAVVR